MIMWFNNVKNSMLGMFKRATSPTIQLRFTTLILLLFLTENTLG